MYCNIVSTQTSRGDDFAIRGVRREGGEKQGIDAINGVKFHVTLVEAEGDLVDVALEVFCGEGVVNPVEASFEARPDAFYLVRACHTVHKLLGTVVDNFVDAFCSLVGRVFIRHQSCILSDV